MFCYFQYLISQDGGGEEWNSVFSEDSLPLCVCVCVCGGGVLTEVTELTSL